MDRLIPCNPTSDSPGMMRSSIVGWCLVPKVCNCHGCRDACANVFGARGAGLLFCSCRVLLTCATLTNLSPDDSLEVTCSSCGVPLGLLRVSSDLEKHLCVVFRQISSMSANKVFVRLKVHVTERVRSVLRTGQDESGSKDEAIL